MTSKTARIWLAGFFDGEGSLWQSPSGPVVRVYQKDLAVLRLIRRFFGGKIRNQKYKASNWQAERFMGRLEWRGEPACALLRKLRPYVRTHSRRKKIAQILSE